jgi:hypothetical protein
LFEGQSPRVDTGVAFNASWLIAVCFQLLAKCEGAVFGFRQLGDIGWRISWWFRDDSASQPCSAFDRVGFSSVGESGEYSGLGEESTDAAFVRDRGEGESGFAEVRQSVVTGHGIICEDVIGLYQFGDGTILTDEISDSFGGFQSQSAADGAIEVGEATFIDGEHIEAVKVEPLRGKFTDESEEMRVIDQSIDFGVQVLAEGTVFGECSELLIGWRIPEEEGEFGCEFVFGEWFGFRATAVFDDEEECGRGENDEE